MLQDHTPIPIDRFLGLYGIDSFTDSVPPGYTMDELNVVTYGDDVRTRDGFGLVYNTGPAVRMEVYRKQGEADRVLILIGSQITDLTTGVMILDVPGMTDFTINYMNGRAFISPHNGVSGVPGSVVYIYNGTGVARPACGKKPVASFNVVLSSTPGVIEEGTHIFAWVFETDSGFITGPCPAKTLLCDGAHSVDFTNIPVGPAGTLGRRLIASMAIQNYNGNELGYEMFFVVGGRIPNNVDTVKNGINFYDADLQFSADYVYDQLEEIPAVCFIRPYGRRMVFGGPDIDKNLIYISKALEPESIHSSAGFLSFDPFETTGVKDATEHRDNLFITKRNKTYTVRDNGYEPSTWNPVTIDSSTGSDINGIAKFLDATGSKVEFFVVANPTGIFKFTGVYEEIPLTRNIKNFWKKINNRSFHLLQIMFDQENLKLYVLAAVDGVTKPNTIFVANYENGFQLDRIKWHKWKFKDFDPRAIAIKRNTDGVPELHVASSIDGIYSQQIDRKDDNFIIIENFIKFAFYQGESNVIHHIGAVGFRVKGSGLLKLRLEGQDDVEFQDLPSLNLSCSPGKEFISLARFQSEKASLKVSMLDAGNHFRIYSIYLYTNSIFASRPLV
jgi:hypothetical protein